MRFKADRKVSALDFASAAFLQTAICTSMWITVRIPHTSASEVEVQASFCILVYVTDTHTCPDVGLR